MKTEVTNILDEHLRKYPTTEAVFLYNRMLRVKVEVKKNPKEKIVSKNKS